MIYCAKNLRKDGSNRMHDNQFACSRHPWTFGERKELERRGNGNLRLSKKSRLSTNAYADQSGIPLAVPGRETRRNTPGKSFYGSIKKRGFTAGRARSRSRLPREDGERDHGQRMRVPRPSCHRPRAEDRGPRYPRLRLMGKGIRGESGQDGQAPASERDRPVPSRK